MNLAWIAGLLEGEGWFGVKKQHRNGEMHLYPVISVGMTDRDVIERIAGLWKVKVQSLKPSASGNFIRYRADLNGRRAVFHANELFPLMGRRRKEQIKEMRKCVH